MALSAVVLDKLNEFIKAMRFMASLYSCNIETTLKFKQFGTKKRASHF
jgi:hypothetical protein